MRTTTAGLKRLRRNAAVNRTTTAAVRALWRERPPTWVLDHLPRTGIVSLQLDRGVSARFHSGEDWVTSRMWWLGVDGVEPETMPLFRRLAASARTVVDVGGYVGHYAIVAAATAPRARVFAFEPVPRVAARLGANLSLNPHLAVTVLPYVVGAARGTSALHVGSAGLPSSSSVRDAWSGLHETITVGKIDLDSFCEEWQVDDVDLIKIDVEGAEPDVVDGMTSLLELSRPVVFTEVHRLGSADDYSRMSGRLIGLRYQLFRLGRGAAPAAVDVLRPGARTENYVAVPSEKVAGILRPA